MAKTSKNQPRIDCKLFKNIILDTVRKNEKPKITNDLLNESNISIIKDMEKCSLTKTFDYNTNLNKSFKDDSDTNNCNEISLDLCCSEINYSEPKTILPNCEFGSFEDSLKNVDSIITAKQEGSHYRPDCSYEYSMPNIRSMSPLNNNYRRRSDVDRRRSDIDRRRSDTYRRRSDIPRISLRRDKLPNKFNHVRKEDDEFREYLEALEKKKDLNNCIVEIEMNFFDMPENYSLAHCVAEDFFMSLGIAVEFRQKYGRIGELLQQKCSQGSVAILQDQARFLYYLVTKQYSSSKPTLLTLFLSLKQMKKHIIANDIKYLAMPKIGCGLDKLDWNSVQFMINFLFGKMDLEIIVCKWRQAMQRTIFKNKIIKLETPLTDLKQRIIIVYFTEENVSVSKEMRDLHESCNFLTEFMKIPRKLARPVITSKENFTLAGCVVKKDIRMDFDFLALENCIKYLNDIKDSFLINSIGFTALYNNKSLNEKIINVLRTYTRYNNIFVYYPSECTVKIGH